MTGGGSKRVCVMIVSKVDVLKFWLDDVGPKGWYNGAEALDKEIRRRFFETWAAASRRDLEDWSLTADGALALLIVLDQFPRNMFRGTALAFSSDACALSIANRAIAQGFDMETDEPQRQFFYLPHMHSESLTQQERGVRLIWERMSEQSTNLLHARAHREVIRRFGRFPFRNEALGRDASPAEESYISEGGYGATVRSLQS